MHHLHDNIFIRLLIHFFELQIEMPFLDLFVYLNMKFTFLKWVLFETYLVHLVHFKSFKISEEESQGQALEKAQA